MIAINITCHAQTANYKQRCYQEIEAGRKTFLTGLQYYPADVSTFGSFMRKADASFSIAQNDFEKIKQGLKSDDSETIQMYLSRMVTMCEDITWMDNENAFASYAVVDAIMANRLNDIFHSKSSHHSAKKQASKPKEVIDLRTKKPAEN